jgi:hypothetical protein
MTKYSLTPGVIVERVGDDLMVIVPGNNDVVSLSGRPAEVLLDVKAGRRVDSADSALGDLVNLGVITAPGLSRRGLIKAGAIGAGAGVAVLAMPGVAAASSTTALQGFWQYDDRNGDGWFQMFFVLDDGFTDESGPSALSVGGSSIPVEDFEKGEGGGAIWERSVDNPGSFTESPLDGTFSWGSPYSVRFAYDESKF